MTLPSIAVVGLGAWGRNHLRIWSELGALRLICDRDEQRVRAAQKDHPGTEGVTTFAEVLAHQEVDAVVIAAPATAHADLARRALEADKDVLVEKPLALTVAEGERLVRLARERKRVLMVGHVLMYHPAVRRLQQLVREGALGRIQYIYSNRLNLGRIRTEESSLWSFAPHDVALTLGLTGGLPESVSCQGGAYLNRGVADVTLTSLSFPGDVRAHIYVSWLHPFKEQRFVVVGDRQMAVFDDTQDWESKLLLYPHRVDWIDGQLPVAHRAEADPVPLTPEEPLRAECEHFLSCLGSRQAPLTDGANALRVLRVLAAAERSMEAKGAPMRELSAPGDRLGPGAL
ncbi:MAG: Gfo/Idh/MocA family oxidoreductase, partial [Polyangia bacterium]|nr:Gfo/Idh/MocA family oxidoreductase [Polyangia bacterium]